MSKISPVVTTAFGIAHTEKRIGQLEEKWYEIINDVETTRGPAGLDGQKGDKGVKGDRGDRGAPVDARLPFRTPDARSI